MMQARNLFLFISLIFLAASVGAAIPNGSFEDAVITNDWNVAWGYADTFLTPILNAIWKTDGSYSGKINSTQASCIVESTTNYLCICASTSRFTHIDYNANFRDYMDCNAVLLNYDYRGGGTGFDAGTGRSIIVLDDNYSTPQRLEIIVQAQTTAGAMPVHCGMNAKYFNFQHKYFTVKQGDVISMDYNFYNTSTGNCYLSLDNITLSATLNISSLEYLPDPAILGQTLTIYATPLSTTSPKKVQCGLDNVNFNLCSSASFVTNPTCSFTNSFTEGSTTTLYCRLFDESTTYGNSSSINLYTRYGTGGYSASEGLNKVGFKMLITSDDLMSVNLSGNKADADATLFEDMNGNKGYVNLLKDTGEMSSVPTCNATSDCDIDVNEGGYTVIFYDSLLNVEYEKQLIVGDFNSFRIYQIALDGYWVQFEAYKSNAPNTSYSINEIKDMAGAAGKFTMEMENVPVFSYKKVKSSVNGLDFINNYINTNKKSWFHYVMPRGEYNNPALVTAPEFQYLNNQGSYATSDTISNIEYFPYFNNTNKISIWPNDGAITQSFSTDKSPVPNIKTVYVEDTVNNMQSDGSISDNMYYLNGGNILCRAVVRNDFGTITNASVKIVGDDFTDINYFSGYLPVYLYGQCPACQYQIDYNFINFAHPTQEVLHCAIQLKNDAGFSSAWAFSAPFKAVNDFNASDINIIVIKTDGTQADPEADIKSANSVFGKITIDGEGLIRDINAFSDTNYSLGVGFYTISYIDVLDSNKLKKFSIEIPAPNSKKLIIIVVGQSNAAPVINNLKCWSQSSETSEFYNPPNKDFLDVIIEATIYDVDGDLNKMVLTFYQDSPDNYLLQLIKQNDSNAGHVYNQYLDEFIRAYNPSKPNVSACVKNSPCWFEYVAPLMSKFLDGNITGGYTPIFCDINVVDGQGHFTFLTSSTYITVPSTLIDGTESFCAYSGISNMVKGKTDTHSFANSASLPFSCKIIVWNKTTATKDFSIYFENDISNLTFANFETESISAVANYYTGTVDVSLWGAGNFEGFGTMVSHSIYGNMIIAVNPLELKGSQPQITPESAGNLKGNDFGQALIGLGNSAWGIATFILFGFMTNPVGWFLTNFVFVIIIIFVYSMIRGK